MAYFRNECRPQVGVFEGQYPEHPETAPRDSGTTGGAAGAHNQFDLQQLRCRVSACENAGIRYILSSYQIFDERIDAKVRTMKNGGFHIMCKHVPPDKLQALPSTMPPAHREASVTAQPFAQRSLQAQRSREISSWCLWSVTTHLCVLQTQDLITYYTYYTIHMGIELVCYFTILTILTILYIWELMVRSPFARRCCLMENSRMRQDRNQRRPKLNPLNPPKSTRIHVNPTESA